MELRQKFKIRKLDDSLLLFDCVIINNDLIFTENANKRLVVYDINGSYNRDIKLSEKPCCISVINKTDVVVTYNSPFMQVINIKTGKVRNDIKTNGKKCLWVSYQNRLLYAIIDKNIIDVMNLKGEVLESFDSPLSSSWYITTAGDRLFLTDPSQEILHCCDLHGLVLWNFTNQNMQRPYSVTADQNGNAYVACALSDNIVVVSSDGKFHKTIDTLKDNLRDQKGIYYDKSSDSLLVFNRTIGSVLLYAINHSN